MKQLQQQHNTTTAQQHKNVSIESHRLTQWIRWQDISRYAPHALLCERRHIFIRFSFCLSLCAVRLPSFKTKSNGSGNILICPQMLTSSFDMRRWWLWWWRDGMGFLSCSCRRLHWFQHCVRCGWNSMRYIYIYTLRACGLRCQASVPFFFSAVAIDTSFSHLQSTQRRAKKNVSRKYTGRTCTNMGSEWFWGK